MSVNLTMTSPLLSSQPSPARLSPRLSLDDTVVLSPLAALETLDGKTMVATPSGKLLSFRMDDASDAPNPVSEAALALANGSHTVRQIAEAIAARFDVTEEQAAADLLNFFEQLISADAFERRR